MILAKYGFDVAEITLIVTTLGLPLVVQIQGHDAQREWELMPLLECSR